jgi:hypothetical protein
MSRTLIDRFRSIVSAGPGAGIALAASGVSARVAGLTVGYIL